MYFESRGQAGQILADKLCDKYRYENSAVVALSTSSVLVAEPIAHRLHCSLNLLLTDNIEIPGENLIYGTVSQTGQFSYNDNLSRFEINEFKNEFYGYFEEQKRICFQKLNRLVGEGGLICKEMIQDRNVILVSDSFDDDFMISAILNYLKPIRFNKLIAVGPIATPKALNKLHMSVDEIDILSIKGNYYGADHYYENNQIPNQNKIFDKINQNILNWQ